MHLINVMYSGFSVSNVKLRSDKAWLYLNSLPDCSTPFFNFSEQPRQRHARTMQKTQKQQLLSWDLWPLQPRHCPVQSNSLVSLSTWHENGWLCCQLCNAQPCAKKMLLKQPLKAGLPSRRQDARAQNYQMMTPWEMEEERELVSLPAFIHPSGSKSAVATTQNKGRIDFEQILLLFLHLV